MCLKNVLCFPNFYGLNFVCLSLTVLIFFVSSTLNFPKSLVNSKLSNLQNFIFYDLRVILIISVVDFGKKAKIIKALALDTIFIDTNFVKVYIILRTNRKSIFR